MIKNRKQMLESRIAKLEKLIKYEQDHEYTWSDGEYTEQDLDDAMEVKDQFVTAADKLKYAMLEVIRSVRVNRDATFQFRQELLEKFEELKSQIDSAEGYFVTFKNKSRLSSHPINK